MPYYNLRSTGTVLYSITKFDDGLNPEANYSVGRTACDCPAGARASCRHRQMLPTLIERVDTAWFYDFEAKSWVDPTGSANKPAPGVEPEPDIDSRHAPTRDDYSDAGIDEGSIGLDGPASFEEAMMAAGEDLNAPLAQPKPAPTFKRRL